MHVRYTVLTIPLMGTVGTDVNEREIYTNSLFYVGDIRV